MLNSIETCICVHVKQLTGKFGVMLKLCRTEEFYLAGPRRGLYCRKFSTVPSRVFSSSLLAEKLFQLIKLTAEMHITGGFFT